MSFLHNFYNKDLKNKLIFFAAIVIVGLVLSFLVEIFYFNFGYFFNNKHIDEDQIKVESFIFDENEDGSYTFKADSGALEYTFPMCYLYKFEFHATTDSDTPVPYIIDAMGGDYQRDRSIIPTFDDSEEVFVIDSFCNRVTIFFQAHKGVTINISDVKFIYAYQFNPVRFITVLIFYFLFAFLALTISGFIKFDYSVNFLVICLVCGTLFSFLIPYNYSWDENEHFIRSYYTSEGILQINEDSEAYFPYGLEAMSEDSYRSLEDFYQFYQDQEENRKEPYTKRNLETTAYSYLFLPYVVSALGINVGKIFGLSLFYLNAFARIANVILYSILVFFAIRLFPSNKKLFFYMALLPNAMIAVISSGPGAMLSGCLFLGIALIANWKENKTEVDLKRFLALLLLFFLVTVARMTYGFFFLMVFLIPKEQYSKNLRKFYPYITIILMILSMGLVYLYSSRTGLSTFDQSNVAVGDQMKYVLSHPLEFVKVLFANSIDYFFSDVLFGNYLGDLANIGLLYEVYSAVAMFFLFVIALCGNEKKLVFDNTKDRILILLMCLMAFGATEAAMYITYTPVSSIHIEGVQGRYLVNIFIALMPILQSRRFEFNYSEQTINRINILFTYFMLVQIGFILLRSFYM